MRIGLAITFVLQCAMGNLLLGETNASAQETASSKELKIRDTEVSVILQRLGAKMETGLTLEQQLNYTKVFRRFDRDGDLRHSKEEYIKNGRYLTPQSRRGIFNASDADKDGFVTQAEYILNRIITDEAKSIIQEMDDDNDGNIQVGEFIEHANPKLNSETLARDVFAAFDTNRDGKIIIPEYLRVWGRWARAGKMSAQERIEKVTRSTDKKPRIHDDESDKSRPRS